MSDLFLAVNEGLLHLKDGLVRLRKQIVQFPVFWNLMIWEDGLESRKGLYYLVLLLIEFGPLFVIDLIYPFFKSLNNIPRLIGLLLFHIVEKLLISAREPLTKSISCMVGVLAEKPIQDT